MPKSYKADKADTPHPSRAHARARVEGTTLTTSRNAPSRACA